MKRLGSKEALELLFRDVINDPNELALDKNRWIRHSIYVGKAAGRIAKAINENWIHYSAFSDYIKENGFLDEDYAITLGYIHDIGRKINHQFHTTEGYKYLMELGYIEESKSTLTHSFIDNEIENSADGVTGKDRYDFINNFLHSVELTPYDNIIQICDLFCLETGFTTVEKRLLDIASRKGVYENSLKHFDKTMELFGRFELDDDYQELVADVYGISKDSISFYNLFPEISKEVLDSRVKDREVLLSLIYKNMSSEVPMLEMK